MADAILGKEYRFSEEGTRAIVKLIACRLQPLEKPDELGDIRYWKFKVVEPLEAGPLFALDKGDEFEVSDRERGPRYCWDASLIT